MKMLLFGSFVSVMLLTIVSVVNAYPRTQSYRVLRRSSLPSSSRFSNSPSSFFPASPTSQEVAATDEESNHPTTMFFAVDEEGRIVTVPSLEQLSEMRKRGLDLGLGRGFSGNQAAKSQVGLIAANLPSGPGKKRRR